MQQAIEALTQRLTEALGKQMLSLYLYGSATMDDFHPGWSDIDVLCLTDGRMPEAQAWELVELRQQLVQETGNPLCRCIEGAVLSSSEFVSGPCRQVVYWGTSGERLTNHYEMNAFSRLTLVRYGQCVAGRDIRCLFHRPTMQDLRAATAQHLATIRQVAAQTEPSLYSCGWLLDICRCLYTLRTGDILPKTAAGKWALRQGLCPVEEELRRTLAVRQEPEKYRNDPPTLAWLSTLGPAVQRFADVLEEELISQQKAVST